MIHRLYLPMSTCLRIPALADQPFRTPDELYETLTAAGLNLAFTEHVRALTPTPDDITSLHLAPPCSSPDDSPPTPRNTHTTLALEETRRTAENTQLAYPLTPQPPEPLPNGAVPSTP
jgi:hypothetical protein